MKSSATLPILALSLVCASCVPEGGVRASSPADVAAATGAVAPPGAVDAAVDARIGRVVGALLPPVVIDGAPAPGMRLEDRLAHYKVPGVSIAVIRDGRVEWARGYGVTRAGSDEPVTPDTVFQACSISKPVAAMAALRWVQEGKLGLDEDVNARLRAWQVPEGELTKARKVTLRRILSHSAGLTVHGFEGYEAGAQAPTLLQILDGKAPANSAAIRVDLEPGSQFRYSGGGYSVLQQLLGDIAQKPFPRIMDDAVLRPLAMAHSTFEQPLPDRLTKTAATAHTEDGKKLSGNWHVYPEMAAAGLWTTPSDLGRFALEVQNARKGTGVVLSREMVDQMLTPQLEGFGLGLFVEGTGASARFSHSGSNEGYRSLLVAGESDLGVAVMTNGDGGHGLIGEIVRAVAKEYGLPGFEVKRKTLARLDPRTLPAYAGRYQLGPNFVLTFTVDQDRLMVKNPEGQITQVFPESATEFFYTLFDAQLTFTREPDGKITQVVLHQRGQDRSGKKLSP